MRTRRAAALTTCLVVFSLMSLVANPADFTFSVTEFAGVARTNELLSSGMPLPRQANVVSSGQLQVQDERGRAVPACFQVLARWNAGRGATNAPIQWLLLDMPVTIGAGESRSFRLAVSEAAWEAPPAFTKLQVTRTNDQVQVDTGAAVFTLGGNPNALFDEIRLPDGTLAVRGRSIVAVANSNQTSHALPRSVRVERQSDFSAVVVVDGAYDLPPIGDGGLASSRRYQFFAGSATALVRQETAWEGSLFSVGMLASEGVPNGVRLQLVRTPLELVLSGPRQGLAWGEIQSPPVSGHLAAGETAQVEQSLRAQRTNAMRFDLTLGSTHFSGASATAGLLAIGDDIRTVGVALYHMHRYEPQALRWLTNGCLAVDIASDRVWLGARQGLFGYFGVSASPGPANPSGLKSALWAKLNHPLRAWPSPAWWAGSKAVEEIPVGNVAGRHQEYDELVSRVLSHTTNQIDLFGLAGLQTYGLFPRYWGDPPEGYNEVGNGADPTPNEGWDDTYWGTTWTDYHNTSALATYWAMRSGECSWLDEIACPAAWRMLHTQIIHGAPEDAYFYIGQAPCGYGGYRSDFNSSHAYFDNLLLYYWLTGDYSVVETLTRGAETMRQYLHPGRPGVPCDPLQPAPNEWAFPVGRSASQWIQVFRFLGLASADASYLEDYRGNLARAVSQHYTELERDRRRYGFWCNLPVILPGSNHTDQIWMATLYDLNNLHRWLVDSDDEPLGSPAIRPSQVLSAWSRTLADLACWTAPNGDGTVEGAWPNMIAFTGIGDRLGGSLVSVTNYLIVGVDDILWDTGKANLCAALSRAADYTQEAVLRRLAEDLTARTIAAAWNQGSPLPLGKIQGLFFARLHAAVARLSASTPPQLQVTRQADAVFVGWPASAQSWRLETAPVLAPHCWCPVTNGFGALGARLASGREPAALFRLRAP